MIFDQSLLLSTTVLNDDFAILTLHYRCLQDCIVGVNKCFYDAIKCDIAIHLS